MGTKGPFASLKQKLIKNGLFLQSVRQDGSEMIQISHARHVNVQEHPGVNSLAAQAALLPRAGRRGQGPGTVAVLHVPSPAPRSRGHPGQGRGRTWAGTSPELWLQLGLLLEHTCTCSVCQHFQYGIASPALLIPVSLGTRSYQHFQAQLEYYVEHCSNFYSDFLLPF